VAAKFSNPFENFQNPFGKGGDDAKESLKVCASQKLQLAATRWQVFAEQWFLQRLHQPGALERSPAAA
jgi:hypothetical protein